MKHKNARLKIWGVVFLLFGLHLHSIAQQETTTVYNTQKTKYVIGGYDVVAYFTEKKPVKGSSAFEYVWNNHTWRFSSQENVLLFQQDPEKYAPQYGGFCAYAMARGYTATIDPHAWTVYKEKLYVNYNASVRRKWKKNIDKEIVAADQTWLSNQF